MKKKIVVISIALALIAILTFGGTLAWFNDTDDVKNVFTIGSIDIEQLEVFEQESQLLPVVGSDPTAANDNYVEKNVTVKNVGKNGAYVQTFVAVPAQLDQAEVLKLYTGNLAAKGWTACGKVASDIAMDGEEMKYNVYLYRYNAILPAGDTNNVTSPCLEYVYIDSKADLNLYDRKDASGAQGTDGVNDTAYFVDASGNELTDFDAFEKLNIYVATQGVQAEGFTDAAAALTGAFAAHPWAN